MTLDEALQVLHCPRDADRAAAQRQYDERYNEPQRLLETATTREEQQACDGELKAVKKAYAFLMDLVGFGPLMTPGPELSPELQQALGSPYADIRVGAVHTLGHLLHEDRDLAPLARQTLEGLLQDASLQANLRHEEMREFFRLLHRHPGQTDIRWEHVDLSHIRTYQQRGCKLGDAAVAAHLEALGVETLVSENRDFLYEIVGLPFRVLRAVEFLRELGEVE